MYSDYIDDYLNEVQYICNTISRNSVVQFINHIKDIKRNNGRLFFLGVGGSAGNASHAVNDFRKILKIESYCPSDNVSELTARINDDGWDTCYSNYLAGSNFCASDAIVIFSVGGGSSTTSLNLCKAIDFAKEKGGKVLSVVSRDGGYSKEKSDVCILIPVVNKNRITPHAEEWQAVIWHLVVNAIKDYE